MLDQKSIRIIMNSLDKDSKDYTKAIKILKSEQRDIIRKIQETAFESNPPRTMKENKKDIPLFRENIHKTLI